MNKAISLLLILAVGVSCRSGASYSHEKNGVPFEDLLGRSMADAFLTGFFVENNCDPEVPFYVCTTLGLAVWFDPNQIAQTIYLYVTAPDGFEPYKGVLPYGLKFYDTMAAVEYKLKRLTEENKQTFDLEVDLSHQGATPDHMHYWVTYERHGIAVIYNSAFADEDATIYAVLVKNLRKNMSIN